MKYLYLFLMIYMFCLLSMMIYSSKVLVILIYLEFLMVCLMMLMFNYYAMESFLEVSLFMVLTVTESLLGLILMLFKVMMSGGDKMEYKNVF